MRAFLQSNGGTPHAQTGATVDAWTNVRAFWCELITDGLQGSASEKTVQQQQREVNSFDLRCRYAPDVKSDKRILIPRNTATLSATVTSGATTLTVSSSGLMADDRDTILRCEDELMIVTAGQGTTSLTVTRGAFGTTAAAHTAAVNLINMQVAEIDGVINVAGKNVELVCSCKVRQNG